MTSRVSLPSRAGRFAAAGALALAGLAGTAATLASPAQAANSYVVNGSTPRPEACNNHGTITPGTWITNGPCGYVVGTALAGNRFEINQTSDKGFHYGRVQLSGGANLCVWIPPGAIDQGSRQSVADSCGDDVKTRNQNSRRIFGRDFDSAPHSGDGAIVVPVDPTACQGYYNYFDNSDFSGGSLRDPVGFALTDTRSGYRYTTKDGKASMIRTDHNGETYWIFVDRGCINGQLPGNLNNQDNPEAG